MYCIQLTHTIAFQSPASHTSVSSAGQPLILSHISQTASDTETVVPDSACVSGYGTPESEKRVDDTVPVPVPAPATGWDQDTVWNQFFATGSVFQPQHQNGNGGIGGQMTPDKMGQSIAADSAAGSGFWSTGADQSYAQVTARPPAVWSTSPMYQSYGPNVFSGFRSGSSGSGSGAAALLPVPPLSPWSSPRNGTIAAVSSAAGNNSVSMYETRPSVSQTLYPDYGTGFRYANQFTGNSVNSATAGRPISGRQVDMAELEEQFRDFKLKPKILMDQYKSLAASRRMRSRTRKPGCMRCVFCLANGEDEKVYRSHVLKDSDGRVQCPVLRLYTCPVCNYPGGDYAHTIKYCPQNKQTFKNLPPIADRKISPMHQHMQSSLNPAPGAPASAFNARK